MENLLNFFFLSGLQKLEFGRCNLFPSWSGKGLISTPVGMIARISYDYIHFTSLIFHGRSRFLHLTSNSATNQVTLVEKYCSVTHHGCYITHNYSVAIESHPYLADWL